MPLNIIKLRDDLILPRKSYYGDAGFDVFVLDDTEIAAHGLKVISTGFGLALKHNEFAQFLIRSSLAKKGLFVANAVVDATYHEETHIYLYNHSDKSYFFKRGDRAASIMINVSPYAEEMDVQEVNIRSMVKYGGSGSSGR